MTHGNNDQYIFDTLFAEILNTYGVCGLMGNLFAESSMKTDCCTGQPYGFIGSAKYISNVDNLKKSNYEFSHDGIAFGLAQWRYYSRKEGLYDMAKEKKMSIGDVKLQVAYLLKEIKTYKTVWKTLKEAKSVKEASDIVLLKYEKPASVSEATKEKRAKYGQEYYDYFTKITPVTPTLTKYVVTTHDKVLYRAGNGSEYGSLGRVEKSGTKYLWVASSQNNWNAVAINKKVVWISGSFSKVVEE